jgi:monothiol glutaredoxin
MDTVQQEIKRQVESNPVILYMKGTPDFPQCGFSMRVAEALKSCGVPFAAVNVLENPDIREGIKLFGNWPTIPQLYVKGQLVGGCDITLELYETGDLQKMLKEAVA